MSSFGLKVGIAGTEPNNSYIKIDRENVPSLVRGSQRIQK